MQLVGMAGSPYVRRVAVSMHLLALPFEHRQVSVFGAFEAFRQVNPVVKAPTLVCDEGTVLMDSTLIMQYLEALPGARRSLFPSGVRELLRTLRITSLAMAACDKSVQIVYEKELRPPEKWHEPWLERVTGQLRAACEALEAELLRAPLQATSATIDQGGVTTAVVWRAVQRMVPELVPVASYPALEGFTARAEALAEFLAVPYD